MRPTDLSTGITSDKAERIQLPMIIRIHLISFQSAGLRAL